MIKHPEQYISNLHNRQIITFEILKDYPIQSTIELWYRYFISLGIRLSKSNDEEDGGGYPFFTVVKYYGRGMYEIKFSLEFNYINGERIPQTIPYHIQMEIEKILNVNDHNFVDCDPYGGEIYVSFNYEEYHMNYVRKGQLDALIQKIKNKSIVNV
jgi:hypothetical protein